MNEHLKEPLLNYKNQTNPGYALLITGDWGSGKTHTITNYLSKDSIYYISLYGLPSEIDIQANIFGVMNPEKKRLKSITEKFNSINIGAYGLRLSLGRFFSALMNSNNNELIKKDKIIVFDDLERCQVDLDITLGVINKYVEHHECRVIVICNDKKSDPLFSLSKEKLFGLTLKVLPDIEQAFDEFTKLKKYDPIKKNLKELILSIFITSKIQSLRILKHTINDCLQLYSILEDKHKENKLCIAELFSLFLAITYEVRSGGIKESDLIFRSEKFKNHFFNNKSAKINMFPMRETDKKEELPSESDVRIKKSIDKYAPIFLGSNIITNDDLINSIFNGNFNRKGICDSVNLSSHFSGARSTPNWIIAYNYYNYENDILEKATEGLKKDFENRRLIIPGEMLHLFHLMFMMSYINEINLSYEDIEKECKEYIDDIYSRGEMEPTEIKFDPYRSNSNYNGYGYWTEDDYKEYAGRVKVYLRSVRQKSFNDQQPAIQNSLMETLRSDVVRFSKIIGYGNGQTGEYYQIPILSGIPAEVFVNTWLLNPTSQRRHVTYSLQHRYANDRLDREMVDEKEWFKEVVKIIEERAATEKGFKNQMLNMLIPSELKEQLFQ